MIACLLFVLIAAQAPTTEESVLPGDSSEYAEALAAYRAGDAENAASILERRIAAGEGSAAHYTLLGWCRLRLAQLDRAASGFGAALELDPRSADALTGRGFVELRRGAVEAAVRSFRTSVELDARSAEAWKGLGLARERTGDAAGARKAFTRAVELAPHDAESRDLLERNLRLPVEERRLRVPRSASEPVNVVARARQGRIELRNGSDWTPIFVKGLNLGTALPGSFPADFPDDEPLYRRWFDQIGELGANVVRLYTLHPPSLYRALYAHNRERPSRKLWLVQGVWSELPAGDDYDGAEFSEGFHAEIRRVIDAVHGNLELPPRPGRAHGIYDVDLSADVLAYLLGREWEPFSVVAYNDLRPERNRFEGRYVRTGVVQPIEAWLASILEMAVAHETETYRSQRPVSYVSWPTLDPLVHPTEATVAEEMTIRGLTRSATDREILEYDNDLVNVDSTALVATDDFPAGLFAAYHVYPYYPDFMVLDPRFARTRDAAGVNRYLGYLRELKAHHGDQPILIAEFGVPASKGVAHLHPEGMHHGGHTTREQGEIDARLMAGIHDAGLAGGILFSWVDEWFKKTWIVSELESPPDRNRLWLNVLDAEQQYGLLAALPGEEGWKIVLDGKDDDWRGSRSLYGGESEPHGGELVDLRVDSDEAYLYLALGVRSGGNPIDWDRREFWIGIDTHDAKLGDHRLPQPAGVVLPIGLEFLVRLSGESSQVLVDRPYDLFRQRDRRPYRSVENDDADFVEPFVETNRERYGRDGTKYPSQGYVRGKLRRGTTDPDSAAHDTLADWIDAPDGSLIELRIAWGLLNVADPSSRQVVHERDRRSGVVQTTTTEGFRFHLLALDASSDPATVIDSFPAGAAAQQSAYPIYQWATWESPTYHLRLKESYFVLQQALNRLEE